MVGNTGIIRAPEKPAAVKRLNAAETVDHRPLDYRAFPPIYPNAARLRLGSPLGICHKGAITFKRNLAAT